MEPTIDEPHAAGEVTEREDLLDGRVRVALAGEAGPWGIDAVFGWRRGRGGAIEIEPQDSYLSLARDEFEVHATALDGTVEVDPDTALARIDARLLIEEGPSAGLRLAAALAVGLESWSGTIRAADGEAPDHAS